IHDLRPGDFRLYEDGIRQEIRSIGLDTNPVSAVLVIDTSATVEKELDKIKEAAEKFAAALSPDDRISVITFDDEVKRVLDWTSDHKQVRRSLRKLQPGIRTALYDAMFTAAGDQLKSIDGRKAIILLTDGLNNQSRVTFREAALAITQSQATLYVVSKTVMVRQAARTQRRVVMLTDIYRKMFGEENYIDRFFEKIEAEMSDLAESTGGRCFFPMDYKQIPGAYEDVARDLKSKYYLTYISNQQKADNSYHRIELQYLQPAGAVNFRRGYFFRPDQIQIPYRRP
ncbi:MAG: VWA domain-containing protein, partial [Acidobacteria bacterium]|nr:VWA domain-containing protein [Acidobacteriota bacterium]